MRRARRRRVLLALTLLLLPGLVAEVGLRVLVVADRLPEAPGYELPFEVSWENYARAWPVDILILGDSMTEHAIPPATFDGLLTEDAGLRIASFNLASSGADARMAFVIVRKLARERRLPPLVVLGISPQILSGEGTFQKNFVQSSLGVRIAGCDWANGLEAWLSCQLTQVSEAWAWRGQPSRIAAAFAEGVPRTLRGPGSPLGQDGFRAGRPSTPDALARDVARLDQNPGTSYRLDPAAAADVVAVADAVRAAGSTLIGFTIPLAPPLVQSLERRHPGWDAERQNAVSAVAREAAISIVDVDAFGPWWKPADSRDAVHLSRLGAPQFTEQLLAILRFRDAIKAVLSPGGDARLLSAREVDGSPGRSGKVR